QPPQDEAVQREQPQPARRILCAARGPAARAARAQRCRQVDLYERRSRAPPGPRRRGGGVRRRDHPPAAGADRRPRHCARPAGAPQLQQPHRARDPPTRPPVRETLAVAARRPDAASRHAPWTADTVFAMFPRLAERKHQIAAHLSGGEQQMLAIGRALMSNPRVLLMDEPSEGLAPQIVADVMATIRKLKESGLSSELVEQSPKLVFDIADDIVILNSGRVAVVATAAELRSADLSQHLGVY